VKEISGTQTVLARMQLWRSSSLRSAGVGTRVVSRKGQITSKGIHKSACVLLLLALFLTGGLEISHYHHLGSSSLMTDQSGSLVSQQYGYRAFGSERFSLSFWPSFTSRFTGQPYDAETGLYYYQSRYYDPELGRFIQPDSIVPNPNSSQSLNRYSYVLNNPLKYIDPTGHAEQGAIWNQPSWGVAGFYDQVGGIDRFPNAGGLLGFGAGRDWLGLGWEAGPGGWDAANDWTGLAGIPSARALWPGSMPVYGPGLDSWEMKSFIEKWRAQPSRAFEDTLKSAAWISLMALPEIGPIARAAAAGRVSATFGVTRMAPFAAKTGLTSTVGDLRAAGLRDVHHVIQDAAVRDLHGYNTLLARGVRLPGPSTAVGTPHYIATQVQRQAGGGTLAAEMRIGYKALRRAGYSEAQARQIIAEAGAYFKSIGATPSTPTRIPGNRN